MLQYSRVRSSGGTSQSSRPTRDRPATAPARARGPPPAAPAHQCRTRHGAGQQDGATGRQQRRPALEAPRDSEHKQRNPGKEGEDDRLCRQRRQGWSEGAAEGACHDAVVAVLIERGHRDTDRRTLPVRLYAAARPPQVSRTVKVTRGEKNAAVSEMIAKRSPIGSTKIRLAQRSAGLRSASRERRPALLPPHPAGDRLVSAGGGAGGAGAAA